MNDYKIEIVRIFMSVGIGIGVLSEIINCFFNILGVRVFYNVMVIGGIFV